MQESEIYWYDNLLLFYPVTEGIAKDLSIWERSIDKGEIKSRTRQCFAIQRRGGKDVGVTYQGFWQRVLKQYVKEGYLPTIHDERTANTEKGYPEPALDKMYGFRFSQEALLTEAMKGNRSGLIGAPTRWGKTSLIINYLRAYPTLTTCVIAPGVDLVKQLYDDITGKFGLPGRRVHLVHGAKNIKGPVLPGDVVVCSADSLGKLDSTQYDLMLADEPHELVTNERITAIDAFTRARRIGFGATLTGRFDGRDKLIEGLFGPVIVERTYKEAVAEGAICPLNVLFLDIELMPRNYYNRLRAYDGMFFKNEEMCNLIKRICDEVVPADFQTLIFIKHEKQADLLQDTIGRDTCVAMAKKLTMKERDEVTAKLKSNTIKRCLCSKIYVKGVTFSDVRVLINAEAGGNNTSSIQKPGRLAEIRPGKKCGIIIDFFFKEAPGYEGVDAKGAWRSLIADSRNRKKAYSDKGYEIAHCASMEELKTKFNDLI